MLSFKIKWEIIFEGGDSITPAVKNPLPSEAKEWDYYEEPHGRRKYILEVIGDSALFLDCWNFKDSTELVYYSRWTNRSKLTNLRRWWMHWTR